MESDNASDVNSCEDGTSLIETIKDIVSNNNAEEESREQYYIVENAVNEQHENMETGGTLISPVEDNDKRSSWSDMCRVCATASDHLIPIFEGEGVEHELCSKIHKHLPIHVTENDSLPLQLCYHCAATLLAWHELAEGCLQAEHHLMEMQNLLSSKSQTPVDVDKKGESHIKSCSNLDRYGSSKKKLFAAYYSSQATTLSAPTTKQKNHIGISPGKSRNAEIVASIDKPHVQCKFKNAQLYVKSDSLDRSGTVDVNSTVEQNVGSNANVLPEIQLSLSHSSNSKKLFKCAACQRVFKKEFNLKRHMIKCKANNDNESVYLKNSDVGSIDKISSDIPYNPERDIHNELKENLEEHIGLNEINDPKQRIDRKRRLCASYLCMHCNYTSKRKKLLNAHIAKIHQDVLNVREDNKIRTFDKEMVMRAQMEVNGKVYYHCDECGKNLYSPYTFSSHMRIHTGERPFTCHLCGKQFRVNQGLARHLRETHAGIKNFPCDICGRMFSTKRTAEDHRRIHTGERPYVCNVCGKTFIQKASLFVHNRIHTDVFPYSCSYCDLRFRTKPHLMIHITKHTGEKPFNCDICNRSFRIKYELKRHKLIHFDEKPWKCVECCRSFRQKRYLINHKKLNHKAT